MMHMLGVPGACPVITEVNSSSVNSVLPPRSCSAYFMNRSFIAFSLLRKIPKEVAVSIQVLDVAWENNDDILLTSKT